MDINYAEVIETLSAPFDESLIQWRPGNVSRDKKKALALAFVDPREYWHRLDEVAAFGVDVRFKPWGDDRLICEITIGGVTRSSTGEMEKGEFAPGTSCEAQALKRACAAWGLGRYLYALPPSWVAFDEGTKRLTERPKIAAKFLPKAAASKPKATPKNEGLEPKLSEDRAKAMQRELSKLGFGSQEKVDSLVISALNEVMGLQDMTEKEALEVWLLA